MWKFTILFATTIAYSQPALPPWLVPFPGSTTGPVKSSAELAETSLTAAANPDAVLEHYRKLFEAANLPFTPNFDGMGTTVRAAAQECDLLLKIREQSAGTVVKISCAARHAGSATPLNGAGMVVTPQQQSQSQTPRLPPSANHERIRQYNEDRARELQAKRDSAAAAQSTDMQKFDRPLPAGAAGFPKPLTPKTPYYDNDAPPLVWPAWLVSHTNEPLHPSPTGGGGPGQSLSTKYTTSTPMTELHRYYLDLIKSHGFTITSSKLTATSTITGAKVMQNKSGQLEAYLKTNSNINGPSTTLRVTYDRMYLDEPITVVLRMTVTGTFAPR